MATLNEIVYNLATQVGKPDDVVLRERLKMMVAYYRALFIRQDQQRNFSIPSQFIQQLDCLEMEEASAMECCYQENIGCTVWRTVKKVPRPVRLYDGSDFIYVGTVDAKQPYQRTTAVQADYSRYSKWSKQHPQYIYTNDRIYVYNTTPKKILVKGIFEDPSDLYGYVCCNNTEIFTADMEYPMSMDMVQRVSQSILSLELRLEDRTDDASEIQLSE